MVNTNGFMFLRCPPKGPKNSGICHEFVKNTDTENAPKGNLQRLFSLSPRTHSTPQLSLISRKQTGAARVVFTSHVAAVDLFICLHANGAGSCFKFCLFSIFVGQQILLQLLEQATADKVTEQQCKLQGKAEELRAPAVARIFNLAFHSILITLVFL